MIDLTDDEIYRLLDDGITPPALAEMIAPIVRNAARCNTCSQEIESAHRHDMQWCGCGNTAVDGGHAYLRRLWRDEAAGFTELSEHRLLPLALQRHQIDTALDGLPPSDPAQFAPGAADRFRESLALLIKERTDA